MPGAVFLGLPHSESEVYYVKQGSIGLTPFGHKSISDFKFEISNY